jgi:uncharacterized cupredoxin-like copper-binding protein
VQKMFLSVVSVMVIIGLAACGNPSPSATKAAVEAQAPASTQVSSGGASNTVQVTLGDNTIQSSLTSFKTGVPYTFEITNSGRHAHNFNIAPPASVAGSIDAALQQALLSVSQDQLGVGQTATVNFTFPDSAAGAQLEFSCLIPRHYEDGMLLPISVTK